jgi:hypothetical protein
MAEHSHYPKFGLMKALLQNDNEVVERTQKITVPIKFVGSVWMSLSAKRTFHVP